MWSSLGSQPLVTEKRWVDSPDQRGTFDILSSCTLTLILCAWTAVHNDIATDKSSWRKNIWARVSQVILGIFAPETLVFISFLQWKLLGPFTNSIQEALRGTTSLTNNYDEADSGITRVKRYHEWTPTHTFYVIMGGFTIDPPREPGLFPMPNGVKQLAISPQAVLWLAKNHPNAIPDISREHIRDKSKSNSLAKTVVCGQALWFCITMVSRLVQGLPLSVLELTTSAHCLCALATFLFWWKKPLNIEDPTPISITRETAQAFAIMTLRSKVGGFAKCDIGTPTGWSLLRNLWFKLGHCEFLASIRPKDYILGLLAPVDGEDATLAKSAKEIKGTVTESSLEEQPYGSPFLAEQFAADIKVKSWLITACPRWRRDASENTTWQKNITLRYPDSLRELICIACPDLKEDGTRDLTPWSTFDGTELSEGDDFLNDWIQDGADNIDTTGDFGSLDELACFFGTSTIYSAIHLTAWNGPFPSRLELLLWRMSAISFTLTASMPMAKIFIYIQSKLDEWEDETTPRWRVRLYRIILYWTRSGALFLGFIFLLSLPIMAFTRVFMMVESFLSLPYSSDETFILPSWSAYLPHIG